jgi:hypothetical protein
MQAPRLEPEPMSGVMVVELGEGGQTPAAKRGERLVSSPPRIAAVCGATALLSGA